MPKLQFTILGENVGPETVDILDLAELLREYRSALAETVRDAGVPSEEIHVSVVSLRKGNSLVADVVADEKTYRNSGRLIQAVNTGDPSGLPRRARLSLVRMGRKGKTRAWDFGLGRDSESAIIRHDKEVFERAVIRGGTSLLVYIIRAGGEPKRTAKIRLPDNEEFTADVASRRTAEQLGNLLYQTVEVRGEARWTADDMKLIGFRIDRVGDYIERDSDPVGALNKLAEASHGFWNTVDPDEYIRELRGD